MFNPFLQKKIERKEYFKGELLVSAANNIVNIPFRYSQTKNRSYNTAFGSGIAVEFTQVTEEIYTSSINLPFAKGSKIKLYDNNILTIKDIVKVFDENKALNGNATTGLLITLS